MLQTYPAFDMSDEQFFEFCQQNRDWRIERTAEGELIIMPPAGWKTGSRNALINASLTMWALQEGTRIAADSSTGFDLPNGATRSPDAAWVTRSRLAALTRMNRKRNFSHSVRTSSLSCVLLQTSENRARENAGVSRQWGAVRLVDRSTRPSRICLSSRGCSGMSRQPDDHLRRPGVARVSFLTSLIFGKQSF